MKILYSFWVLLFYTLTACKMQLNDGVCYKYLGCFSQSSPWVSVHRPFPPPAPPKIINVTVICYSRTQNNGQLLDVYPTISSNITGFSPNKTTVLIIHGYAQSRNSSWVINLRTKYLENIDANVCVVDWAQGANIVNYLQAAANARVVGAIMGRFSKYLINNQSVSYSNFHIMGHSLGAHIAGYTANIMNNNSANGEKVFRITGFDPAQPGFQDESPIVRLNKDNANFIDIIHSDAKPFIPFFGLGYLSPLGDVDFYLNHGHDQPGCTDYNLIITSILDLAKYNATEMKRLVFCSHLRSVQVFVSAIDSAVQCDFIGHRVTGREPITSNQFSCGDQGMDCIKMGLNTPNEKPRGVFQVMTSGQDPYCCFNYSKLTGCHNSP